MRLQSGSNYINSVENGKYFPSLETIEQIAAALGIRPCALFESDTEKDGAIRPEELEKKIQKAVSSGIMRVFVELSSESLS